MQGLFSARRLAGLIAALAAMVVFAAPAMASGDRNHDGIPDKWERKHDLSLKHSQAKKDQDSDGLKNKGEFRASFDPQDADTDDDGVEDGDEGAGTVGTFNDTTGELVINLFGGGTVTGTVTTDTEIECENDDDVQPDDGDVIGDELTDDNGDDGPGHTKSGGDDGPGDNSGPGNGDDDDDSGPGDDDAGDDDESCDATALQPGTVVREAEVDVTATGLVFEEIELS
jgi:hypothetical protein